MGVYYKLVNRVTKERIEPGDIGGGGIKFGPMVAGPSARLLMFLHLTGQKDWTVLDDCGDEYYDAEKPDSPHYLVDVTEKIRQQFNARWQGSEHIIERSEYASPLATEEVKP